MSDIVNKIRMKTVEEMQKVAMIEGEGEKIMSQLEREMVMVEEGLLDPHWCNFIPEYLINMWNELSRETRLVAMLIAAANLTDYVINLTEPSFKKGSVKIH